MSFIAILGAGAIGGSLAHRLAVRGRVREVRLIDVEGRIARGKALDILQSSPIDRFSTRVTSGEKVEDAAGAAVIVIADAASDGAEHTGEPGLAVVRRLSAIETASPLLFAGAGQRELMARVISELHVPARRVIGSAPGALEAAVRALTALELNATGVDVQLRVVGVPPRAAVIAWEEATAGGQPVGAVIPAHRLSAISGRVPGLWPPGPLALASAAARAAEGLGHGSRRVFTCFVSVDGPAGQGAVAAMPAELERGGILRVLRPALSRQEEIRLENGFAIGFVS